MQKGGCRCGAIAFDLEGDARFQLQCHCKECQSWTGTGHAPLMIFPKSGFTVHGSPVTWSYTADSGVTVTHHFCGTCGSPMFNTNSHFEKAVYVLVGALEDKSSFAPQRVIYTDSAHDWDFTDPDLPHFPAMPTS